MEELNEINFRFDKKGIEFLFSQHMKKELYSITVTLVLDSIKSLQNFKVFVNIEYHILIARS
jgi:hypothetical protein